MPFDGLRANGVYERTVLGFIPSGAIPFNAFPYPKNCLQSVAQILSLIISPFAAENISAHTPRNDVLSAMALDGPWHYPITPRP